MPERTGCGVMVGRKTWVSILNHAADRQAPFPLQPRKEPLRKPPALVPPQVAAILRLEFPHGPVWRDQAHAVLLEVVIESIAVIRTITDEVLGFGLQHVEVETELHQRDLMMIGRVCAHRERQPMAIHNRKDLHAFARRGGPIPAPPPLAEATVASMKLSRSSISPSSRHY